MQGKIISIMNHKGGVGKTTLTANIGAKLALRGKRVLLVDADSQGSLTGHFLPVELIENIRQIPRVSAFYESDKSLYNQEYDLNDLIVYPERINELLEEEYSEGCLAIIPSDIFITKKKSNIIHNIFKLEEQIDEKITQKKILPSLYEDRKDFEIKSSYEKILNMYSCLRENIYNLDDDFDIIIIDCNPSLEILEHIAIASSDSLVIAVKPDSQSLNGIIAILTQMNKIQELYNKYIGYAKSIKEKINPKIIGVAVSMVAYNNTSRYVNSVASAIREIQDGANEFGYKVFSSHIRDNKAEIIQESEFGIPITCLKRLQRSPIVGDLNNLVNEFEEALWE